MQNMFGVSSKPVRRRYGQTEDEVEAVSHHAIMAGGEWPAADGHAGQGPVPADAADEASQMAAHLRARGRLAGAQQHGDRSAGCHIVDKNPAESSARRKGH